MLSGKRDLIFIGTAGRSTNKGEIICRLKSPEDYGTFSETAGLSRALILDSG